MGIVPCVFSMPLSLAVSRLLVHLRLFFALRPVVTLAATLYLCLRVFVVNLWIVAAAVRRQKIRHLTMAATFYSCIRVFVSLCLCVREF